MSQTGIHAYGGASKPRETAIVKSIMDWLRSTPGMWAYKTHGSPYQPAGLPDIIGGYYGLLFGIEVKIPGKEATPIQEAMAQKMRHQNIAVITAHSLDEVRLLLPPLLDMQVANGMRCPGKILAQ